MPTQFLTTLYDQLTPFERLPLIIAAGARNDAIEQRRLSSAAPDISLQVPDYSPLAKALNQAVSYHLLTLLDVAAKFWQWWGLWMTQAVNPSGRTARAPK